MVRILIIDDDADFGHLAKERLHGLGARVNFHRGPFGSLTAIQEFPYDLVLMDVNMPNLDGAQLVRLMREVRGARSPKVLLCSSMDVDQLSKLAQSLGVQGYLSKSATKSQFLDKIREVVSLE
jgi:CheY-like chemotaxis protein